MDMVLDRAAFGRDGFGVVRGAVAGPLLASLRAAVQRVQDSVPLLPPLLRDRLTLERDLPDDRRGGVAADAVGDAIFILGDPVAFDDIFWTVLRLPVVAAAVRQAVGVPEVAAHLMNVTIKNPGFGRGMAWHRDYPNRYACPPTSCFVRAMLCLDGMSADGGATTFLPGSHRLDDDSARAWRRPRGWEPGAEDIARVCCEPGDLVVIHPKVLHGGGMNTTQAPRRNLILQAGDAAVPLESVPDQEAVSGCRLAAG